MYSENTLCNQVCCNFVISSQLSSVAQSCPTLCDLVDCSTSGFLVHNQLPELTQTHVHRVGDAIQHLILCHPLLLPPSTFPRIRVFSKESVLHIRRPKASASDLPMNVQDWFPLGWTGLISFSPRDSQEFSPASQFKSINSLALSSLYGPTLTSIHDYWKNYSLD